MTQEELQALEELKGGVATLATAVDDLKQGRIDEENVRRIVEDVLEAQDEANPGLQRRRGYEPQPDEETARADEVLEKRLQKRLGTGAQRLQTMQTMPAKKVARITRIPVDVVDEFHQASNAIAIMDAIIQSRRGSGDEGWPDDVRETAFYNDEFLPLVQAMDTATTAEGTEFVPRQLSPNLIERINLELRVAALFPLLTMPTNPWDIPGKAVSRQRIGSHAEQTADTGQTTFTKRTIASRKVTLTAVKFAGEALTSKELEEDSLIAILPLIEEELVEFLAADVEDTVINGDTTATHMDSDVTASDDPRKLWAGLRKLAIAGAKTDLSNADPTVANSIRANRAKMGKYGVRAAQLAHLVSMSGYIKLLADANVLTLEKYGPNATILAGELGRVDGSPIVVSEYVREDLNATGVYDGTTTNRSETVTVNRAGFALGERRGVTVQVLRELYAESDQDAITISRRLAFAGRFPNATEKTVAVAYNQKTT